MIIVEAVARQLRIYKTMDSVSSSRSHAWDCNMFCSSANVHKLAVQTSQHLHHDKAGSHQQCMAHGMNKYAAEPESCTELTEQYC